MKENNQAKKTNSSIFSYMTLFYDRGVWASVHSPQINPWDTYYLQSTIGTGYLHQRD